MATLINATVGSGDVPVTSGDGNVLPLRAGKQGELTVSEYHGRFYEANYRTHQYRAGTTAGYAALSANSITTVLTATSTPILALWNPLSSGVALEVLQATLKLVINTLTTPVSPGDLVWAASAGNAALTLGSAAYNAKTLQTGASQTKFFGGNVALTGLANSLVLLGASDFPTIGTQTLGTIAATSILQPLTTTINIDGSIILQPGEVLALLNTTSTTTFSSSGSFLWNEIAI